MNKMSTKHLMFFIIAVSIITLRSYSSIFINYGGRDSALIAVIASVLIYIYFIMLIQVCEKTGTYNFLDIIKNSFPKSIGNLMILLFSTGLFLASVESASVESSSIHTNFFISTPTWYCLLFFIIPAAYVLNKNFSSILITVILSVSMVLVGDIILFILLAKYLDFNYLMPILKDGFTQNKWICLLEIVCSLSSIAIVLPHLSHLDSKKYLKRYSRFAIIACAILVIASFVSIITFFGPERAANIFYPEFVASQRVQIASFLEFGELFYIFRSVIMWFLKYILASYGIILLYKDKINNKKIFIILYSTIIFVASYILTENQYYLFNTLEIMQLILGFIFIIVPAICFSTYYFKFRKNINKTR